MVALVIALVLGVGLAATYVVSRSVSAQGQAAARARFDTLVTEVTARLGQRIDAYAQILRGGAGLVRTSPAIDRQRWATYYEALEIPQRFPGVQTFLWVPLVPERGRARFEQELRRLGHPDFRIWTRDAVPPRTTIAFVEPFTAINAKALGFDMFSEPVRQAAMIRARDTGEMSITAKVNLVIDDRPLPGFIMYVPVFGNAAVPADLEARRSALVGYVSSAFRVADLLHATVGETSRHVRLEVFDGHVRDPMGLLYDSAADNPNADRTHTPRFTHREEFRIGGRIWSVHVSSIAAFEQTAEDNRAALIAIAGVLLTALAAGIAALTVSLRRQTAALSATTESLRHHQAELEGANAALVQARDDALTAARAKSEFLANMSHEIRTPIHGFLGHTELALANALDAETRGYLETAHDCGQALLAVVNDILDFSKLEAGKLELERVRFDLRELVLQCVRTVHLRAEESSLALIWSVDAQVPRFLIGDPNRIRQVLLNLLSNAVKFTPVGEVELRVQLVEARDPALSLRFSVRDTGIGMDTETRDGLFQAFYQADASITRRFGGTGLGLAISAHIVTLMGGAIEVESTPRKGSEFHFTIELCPERDTAPRLDRPALKVAVIDRNQHRAVALVRLLLPLGVEATPFESLRYLRGAPDELDAVIIDVDAFERDASGAPHPILSSMNRVVVLQAARSTENRIGDGKAVRVIVQTYPVDPAALADAIRAAPGRRTARETPASAIAARPLEVLVAEDNPVNRALIERMLARAGQHPTLVGDGSAAVTACADRDFDLVLMDLQMPVMDGLEATRRIRDVNRRTHRRSPAIYALTADALPGDRERCLAAGMDGYLAKPLSMAQLEDVLATVRQGVSAPADQLVD